MVDFGDRHKRDFPSLEGLIQRENSKLRVALDCTDSETRSAVEKIIAQYQIKDWVIGDLLNPQPLLHSLLFYSVLPEESAAAIEKLRSDFLGPKPIASFLSLSSLFLYTRLKYAIGA
jgi:hypothetical protein